MRNFYHFVVFTTIFSTTSVFSQVENSSETNVLPTQNPPINMETVIGSRGIMYQLLVNKNFQSTPKLGFFSITHVNAAWEKEPNPDVMTQAHLTYTLFKGLDVSAGMQYSPAYHFRPVAALIYSYATPEFVLILNPKIDLADDLASENMALIEYKPKINEKLNIYSRVQGLYGFVPESGVHNRSYVMLRAGLSYKEFSFGAASNFDWYGPVKHSEHSYGVFLSALLF